MSDTPHTPANSPPYWNPYWAGFILGIILLATFVVMGRGLGASGAFTSAVATVVHGVAPAHAESNAFYARYLGDGSTSPMKDWLVFEVIGVLLGGFLSAILARRLKLKIEKGPNISTRGRLILAVIGGVLMGIGAKLAMGCTSGQGLSGGAMLNLGSWAFMICVFAGAYAMAWFVRRQWL